VKDLPKLKELGFAWNEKIKPLPTFLTHLTELTTLHLDSDGLIDLPDFLNTLPKLTHVTLGDNCRITKSPLKKKALQKRFPKIKFDFANEYDC
jgi:Leucine-rich repeat (LRR) protein